MAAKKGAAASEAKEAVEAVKKKAKKAATKKAQDELVVAADEAVKKRSRAQKEQTPEASAELTAKRRERMLELRRWMAEKRAQAAAAAEAAAAAAAAAKAAEEEERLALAEQRRLIAERQAAIHRASQQAAAEEAERKRLARLSEELSSTRGKAIARYFEEKKAAAKSEAEARQREALERREARKKATYDKKVAEAIAQGKPPPKPRKIAGPALPSERVVVPEMNTPHYVVMSFRLDDEGKKRANDPYHFWDRTLRLQKKREGKLVFDSDGEPLTEDVKDSARQQATRQALALILKGAIDVAIRDTGSNVSWDVKLRKDSKDRLEWTQRLTKKGELTGIAPVLYEVWRTHKAIGYGKLWSIHKKESDAKAQAERLNATSKKYGLPFFGKVKPIFRLAKSFEVWIHEPGRVEDGAGDSLVSKHTSYNDAAAVVERLNAAGKDARVVPNYRA